MEYQIDHLSPTEKKIHFSFTVEEVSQQAKRIFRLISQKVHFPGFRPGKVPISLILARYREDVEEDLQQELIRQYLKEIAEKESLKFLDPLEVEVFNWEPNQSAEMTVLAEAIPNLETPSLQDIDIPTIEVTVSEEAVQEVLENLREKQSFLEPVEGPVEKESIVSVDLEMKKDGEWQKVGITNLSPSGKNPIIELEGKQKGEVIQFTQEAQDSDPPNPVTYRGKILEVKRKVQVPIDDNLAKTVLENEDATLEDLMEQIREELHQKGLEEKKRQKEEAIIDQLLARVDIPVPKGMLEKELKAYQKLLAHELYRQGIQPNKEALEKAARDYEPKAIRNIQERLLLEHFEKVYNIQVSEDDLLSILQTQIPKERFWEEVRKMKKNGTFERFRRDVIRQNTKERLIKEVEEKNADTHRG